MSYAPGLALQVSGVSYFWIWLDGCFGLRFPSLRLLDRLSDQLVDGFTRDVYTYEKGCHALIKTMQRTMQGTHDAKRQLKENTTWQRFARDLLQASK